MTCFSCKGNVAESTTTYMSEYNGCYIIIKNVPCNMHSMRRRYIEMAITLKKIETIISHLKDLLTEVAIVDYNKAA